MDYYRVKHWVDNRLAGTHIILAKDKDDALRIANKFEIKSPNIEMKDITWTQILTFRAEWHKKFILNRRRKGKGGNIYYEDEKGQLRKELAVNHAHIEQLIEYLQNLKEKPDLEEKYEIDWVGQNLGIRDITTPEDKYRDVRQTGENELVITIHRLPDKTELELWEEKYKELHEKKE